MRLILAGGTVVLSLNPVRVAVADVAIEDGRIADVGPAGDGDPRMDCSGCLVVPGNVCAHMHLYSALARGMPYSLDRPRTFVQILQRIWWRLDRALDEESIRASALVGGMEALLSGTTTLVDHHASPNAIDGSLDVIAEALEEIGIRSVLCYEVTDRDGPERATAGIEENGRFLRKRRPLARGMMGAHASFTLTPETLSACVGAARDAECGVHVHVAEDAADQGDARARFGTGVVERLLGAGTPPEESLFAHCVHVDPAEQGLIREAGVTIAHNARSNMNNGVGRAPVAGLGDHVALGTDGIDGDMFAESQTAYFRRREEDPSAGPGWPLHQLAVGARFAGHRFGQPLLGLIEGGAPADLVVLESPAPAPITEETLPGQWLFGLASRHVRDVVVDGVVTVAGRRLARADQDRIASDAAASARRLWRRLEDIDPHPFEPVGRV